MKQLLLDLEGLTDERRIHRIVSERFAAFGEVNSLKVFDQPERNSRIILVTMNSTQAAATAIGSLGLMSFGERSLVIDVPNGHS